MKKVSSIIAASLLMLAACNSVTEKQTNTAFPDLFYKKLKGTINGNIRITMDLKKTDSLLSGEYFYDKIRVPLALNGKITPSGEIELLERGDNGKTTGTFKGKFITPDSLAGNWTNTVSGKILPFSLKERYDEACEITFIRYQKENCLRAVKYKRNLSEITSSFDTVCSKLDLTFIQVKTKLQIVSNEINRNLVESLAHNYSNVDNDSYKSINEFVEGFTNKEPDFYYQLIDDYNVTINDKNVLIIWKCEHYEEQENLHPHPSTEFLNFDLLTGNQIALDDALLPKYKERLIQVAEKIFNEQCAEGETFDPIKLVLGKDFSIGWEGFTFQYAGTYIGTNDIFIPYKEISELINPKGVISRLWHPKR
jgi:hypothetical protein